MKYVVLCLVCVILSCQSPNKPAATMPEKPVTTAQKAVELDVQGHRGARGLYPENSIEGFKAALDMGVTTLELDLCMTKDAIVIVSHEPWMNANICQTLNGDRIPESKQLTYNIYEMSYQAVKNYDCGSLGNPWFPEQKKMKTYKPTFAEAVTESDKYAKEKGMPLPRYNAEIKRRKGYDGQFHPDYDFFARTVMIDIANLGIADRTTVQSFDVQTLEFLNVNYSDQELAYLVNEGNEVKASMAKINFTPEIYSPHFSLLTKSNVEWLQQKGMKVIPWTVNETADMEKLIDMGVDGIITDYPDRLMKLVK